MNSFIKDIPYIKREKGAGDITFMKIFYTKFGKLYFLVMDEFRSLSHLQHSQKATKRHFLNLSTELCGLRSERYFQTTGI